MLKIPFQFLNGPSYLQDKIKTPSLALNSSAYFLLLPTPAPFHACGGFSWLLEQLQQTIMPVQNSSPSDTPFLQIILINGSSPEIQLSGPLHREVFPSLSKWDCLGASFLCNMATGECIQFSLAFLPATQCGPGTNSLGVTWELIRNADPHLTQIGRVRICILTRYPVDV